ncbi:MAG TPA: inner membrane-spanning protein YciB [Allosphingosinicella sp.]|jgi:intracellular septation protein
MIREDAAPTAGARLLVDLGPLLIFFAVNFIRGDVIEATIAFMVAITAALIFSWAKYRHISPLLWFSAFMVLVLGALTVWLNSKTFIQIKPTVYYILVGALLLFGLMTKRNLLKIVLGTAYPGLSDEGWRVLTLNWALFFFAMALVNELVRLTMSWNFWIGFKLWGALPATFIFALANVPMLMRHGLELEAKEEPPVPPSQ